MLVFDPDGPGPIGERVLVSGAFQIAGSVAVDDLAVYDPVTRVWAAFGPGPYPRNLRLAVDVTGALYVAGDFTAIAGVGAANIARFDGTGWSALAAGLDDAVEHLEVMPNGDVVVTGQFTTAGGVPTAGIARWDGSSWSALGATSFGSISFGAIASLPNGHLCAAAQWLQGSSWQQGVLEYDGNNWSQLGPSFGTRPTALLALPSGQLVAGGQSVPGTLQQRVARWDGAGWFALAGAPVTYVNDLAVMANGTIAVAGRFNSTAQSRVATWTGSTWAVVGDATDEINDLCGLPGGELLAGGRMQAIAGVAVGGLARWDGAAWAAASPGLVGSQSRLAAAPDGSLYIAASFGGVGEGLVRRWNGVGWTAIGGGFIYAASGTPRLQAMIALANGDVVTGGPSSGSSTPSPVLQRWGGSGWTTLATSQTGGVTAVAELADGALVAGGSFQALDGVSMLNVGRFDGVAWSPLGPGLPANVDDLEVAPSGEVLALVSSRVFRWTGAAWAQIGLAMVGTARDLAVGGDGRPIMAGDFQGPDVWRWNGSVWAPVGNGPAGPAQSIAVLPNGDLVVGPLIDTTNPPRAIERWNGSSWAAMGGPVDATVRAITFERAGDLVLAGDFAVANGAVRARFARVSTSCQAGVVPVASGCSYYGAQQFQADVLPWLGGTCRSTASSLPANSLAVVVGGVSPSQTALASLLPQAANGCTLLVVPDVVAVSLPIAGEVVVQVSVPNAAGLLGVTFRQQVVSITLDGSGLISAATATNALDYVVGSF